MTGFKNSKRDSFFQNLPEASIEAPTDDTAKRCKFNFSYFSSHDAGQSFDDLSEVDLRLLLDKLRYYSRESLLHWTRQPMGASGSVLAIYGRFPTRSDFTHPASVPIEAQWGRFRLDAAMRFVGFVLPDRYRGMMQVSTKELFDCNTFYVVFLDKNHRFYITEKR